MVQVAYRANLSAKSFPLLAENWGQTVIVPQTDNTYNRQVSATTASETQDPEAGIPQIYYCHNVLPNEQGFQSIGYQQLNGPAGGSNGFSDVFEIRDDITSWAALVGVDSSYNLYILHRDTGFIWQYKTNVGASIPGASKKVYCFHTNGYSYIFFQTTSAARLLRYDFTTAAFVDVTASGLDMTAITGMSTAAGYVIAWTDNKIFWSSTLPIVGDVIDFVPSLITGAGSQSLEAVKGPITFCETLAMGFIVYTEQNAVAAIYQQNANSPFNFKEIPASGGVADRRQFAPDANSGNHWVYSNSGVQLNTITSSTTTFPEVTSFLSGNRMEQFDPVSGIFSRYPDGGKYKRVNVCLSRYLVFSYGTGIDPATLVPLYDYALVYDLILKRWGKLKIQHVQVFEYNVNNPAITEPARQSMAFLKLDGSISRIDFSYSNITADGCLVLGKYQYVRARDLQLDVVQLEAIDPASNFSLSILTSLDGRNTTRSAPDLIKPLTETRDLRVYGCRAVGRNHSIVLAGSFKVVSVELIFNIHGKQ